MNDFICDADRKEALRFLLVKTAAVRSGVKPGELLRVRHCYKSQTQADSPFSFTRDDVLKILKLDYVRLRVEDNSSLVLFFHRDALRRAVSQPENFATLQRCGYPESRDLKTFLRTLYQRFSIEKFPHEVGVFIGYPAKDVVGFIEKNRPRTPCRCPWTVFGDATESLFLSNLYRQTELFAQSVLDACESLQTFFETVANYRLVNSETVAA